MSMDVISQEDFCLLIKDRSAVSKLLEFYNRDIVSAKIGNNIQVNPTPIDICRKLTNRVKNLNKKDILVLINIELVDHLIFDCFVKPENITFVAENEFESLFCRKIFKGIQTTVISFEKNDIKNISKEIKKMNKKFDLVLTNPPYNNGLDLKILNEVVDIADEIVCVHPATWLLDLKGKKKTYTVFKDKIKNQCKSFEMFNGNPVFRNSQNKPIALFVPCVITHIDKNHKGQIDVNYFNERYSVSSIDEITKFGKAWNNVVKPFYEKIKYYVDDKNGYGNVWEKRILKINPLNSQKYYCQLSCISGNSEKKDYNKPFKNCFYTIIQQDNDNSHKGIKDARDNHNPTFCFDTEFERDNFLKYLKTNFSRFCLSLYKINVHLDRGELEIIPWLDFTQEWNDEKIYEYFEINKETQKCIEEFFIKLS